MTATIDNFTLEQLGFIECSNEPEFIVEIARVIFFSQTPICKRDRLYYLKMITHICNSLKKQNVHYDHIKIDWAPELFKFVPRHRHYNPQKNILYFHVSE